MRIYLGCMLPLSLKGDAGNWLGSLPTSSSWSIRTSLEVLLVHKWLFFRRKTDARVGNTTQTSSATLFFEPL